MPAVSVRSLLQEKTEQAERARRESLKRWCLLLVESREIDEDVVGRQTVYNALGGVDTGGVDVVK